MRTIETKVYTYDELSEVAQERARDWYAGLIEISEWTECLYEEAKELGFKIVEFDIDRGNHIKIKILTTVGQVIEQILANHGEACDTYQLALKTKAVIDKLTDEDYSDNDKIDDISYDFKHALGEEYLSLLRAEYEYVFSDAVVAESLVANEYEFDECGERI